MTTSSTPIISSPISGVSSFSPQMAVTWSAVTGAKVYEVNVGNSPRFSNSILLKAYSTSASLFVATGTWFVRVRVFGDPMNEWSGVVRFTRQGALAPTLVLPVGDAEVASPVTFTWLASAGVSKYRIRTASALIGPWSATEVGNVLTHTVTMPVGDVYWKLEAYDGTRWSVPSEVRHCTRKPVGAPVCVSPVVDAQLSGGTVTFVWEAVAGIQFYNLEVCKTADFAGTVIIVAGLKVLTTSMTLAQGVWHWRVRAWDGVAFGSYSVARAFVRTAPEAPLL